jgi:hypothetical protein
MKQLHYLRDRPLGFYDEIVATKHQSRRRILEELRPRIANAYRRYDRKKPELDRLRALNLKPHEAEALLHCYQGARSNKQSRSPRDRIYARIRALAFECPYCTLPPVKTLDHYLPKALFPEFAILVLNLVPSCSACNRPRDYRNTARERALIHPYFDTISNERLLVAKVRILAGLPDVKFSVNLSRCTDLSFGRLYKRHFALLRLRTRYRRWAMSDYGISTIVPREWVRHFSRDRARVILEEQARAEEAKLGANHFKVALIRGAAASDVFLDYCTRGTP